MLIVFRVVLTRPVITGVGGLAVAYMLSRAGHRVQVLEKRRLDVPSGGQRVPPNCSKILRQWVGEEELWKVATRCVGTPMHRCRCPVNGLDERRETCLPPFGIERLLTSAASTCS